MVSQLVVGSAYSSQYSEISRNSAPLQQGHKKMDTQILVLAQRFLDDE